MISISTSIAACSQILKKTIHQCIQFKLVELRIACNCKQPFDAELRREEKTDHECRRIQLETTRIGLRRCMRTFTHRRRARKERLLTITNWLRCSSLSLSLQSWFPISILHCIGIDSLLLFSPHSSLRSLSLLFQSHRTRRGRVQSSPIREGLIRRARESLHLSHIDIDSCMGEESEGGQEVETGGLRQRGGKIRNEDGRGVGVSSSSSSRGSSSRICTGISGGRTESKSGICKFRSPWLTFA